MSKDYARLPIDEIRYKGRAIQDEGWIRRFLARMPFGVLATAYEGQPFAMTTLFVYEEAAHAIYLHTAQVGRTRANVEADGRACFTVARMGRLLPDRRPVEVDVEYASAVVFGPIGLIEEDGEKRRILGLLLQKYTPHLAMGGYYEPIPDSDVQRTSVYRLQIERWSAKMNRAEPDFPDAFTYPLDDTWE